MKLFSQLFAKESFRTKRPSFNKVLVLWKIGKSCRRQHRYLFAGPGWNFRGSAEPVPELVGRHRRRFRDRRRVRVRQLPTDAAAQRKRPSPGLRFGDRLENEPPRHASAGNVNHLCCQALGSVVEWFEVSVSLAPTSWIQIPIQRIFDSKLYD